MTPVPVPALPARSDVRALVEDYLARHPAERVPLRPLLAVLDAAAEPTSRATLPGHVTCSAVVVDRNRRILHVRRRATGLVLPPGGHAEPGDRTLLATVLREVAEETGIRPGALCLTARYLGTPIDIDVQEAAPDPLRGESAHRHYDVRFVLCLADDEPQPLALDDAGVPHAQWRAFADVTSPSLRAKLLAAEDHGIDGVDRGDAGDGLDGLPRPVNASALIHDNSGRYLLHLRDNYPHIWEPGAFALLGGGREPDDKSLEETLLRELAEEVPELRLSDLTPFAVERATGVDGLCLPVQVFAGRWNGDPDSLTLNEGVLLRWFAPDMLHRLRLHPSTIALVHRHAAQTDPPERPIDA
ncbi:NUDIX hydrolase [Streptomyces liangshanensis]|uniref:NUDIX hydrolase n=1 Tax=Streptomyces liangshanensis TaxID=2717324 RepID=UPI001FB8C576|nr:NUDIX domain-containing protein [Streptomyces liangshanensis]